MERCLRYLQAGDALAGSVSPTFAKDMQKCKLSMAFIVIQYNILIHNLQCLIVSNMISDCAFLVSLLKRTIILHNIIVIIIAKTPLTFNA